MLSKSYTRVCLSIHTCLQAELQNRWLRGDTIAGYMACMVPTESYTDDSIGLSECSVALPGTTGGYTTQLFLARDITDPHNHVFSVFVASKEAYASKISSIFSTLAYDVWEDIKDETLRFPTYTCSSLVEAVDIMCDLFSLSDQFADFAEQTYEYRVTRYGIVPVGFERYAPVVDAFNDWVGAQAEIMSVLYSSEGVIAVLATGRIVGLWLPRPDNKDEASVGVPDGIVFSARSVRDIGHVYDDVVECSFADGNVKQVL